jgi:benzylsuccinate CoA-transferase BbsF subunit
MMLPLEGIRVIDFGQTWAGPVVSSLLGDLGAEVIKVESRKRIDSLRMSPDNVTRDPEEDPWFHAANRNKWGITIDIAHPKAKPIVLKLISFSDVVVENFSPEVMERYGLDYNSLRKVKPDIIMISLPAVGMQGPLRDVRTYGPSLNGIAGIDSLIGYPGGKVLGMQQGYADANAAIHGALAVLIALFHRRRTGEGQYIEVAQMEALISTIGEAIMEYFMTGVVPQPRGNWSPTMAPHNNFPCQGDDKWVSISVKTDEEWEGLKKALGNPPWMEEERFSDRYKRLENRHELEKFIATWTKEHDHYEVAHLLQSHGVAAFPCLDVEDRFLDPWYKERETYQSLEHPRTGIDWLPNIPWMMSKTPGKIRSPAPLMGQHNEYVFCHLLGMSKEEVENLMKEGVLY